MPLMTASVEMEQHSGPSPSNFTTAHPSTGTIFIKLAETEYYDNMLFHRVINGFMIQGGDPDSKTAKKDKDLSRRTRLYGAC